MADDILVRDGKTVRHQLQNLNRHYKAKLQLGEGLPSCIGVWVQLTSSSFSSLDYLSCLSLNNLLMSLYDEDQTLGLASS